MEPEGSSPHSQVPTTFLYPEPAHSSPYPTSYLLNSRKDYVNEKFQWHNLESNPFRFVAQFLNQVHRGESAPVLKNKITQFLFW
jgi:hypothetical protein